MNPLLYVEDLFSLMRESNIFLGTSLERDEYDDFFSIKTNILSSRLSRIVGQDINISLFDTGELMLEINFDVYRLEGKKKDFLVRTMEYLETKENLNGSDIIEFERKTVFLVSVKDVNGDNLKESYSILEQILNAIVDELDEMN